MKAVERRLAAVEEAIDPTPEKYTIRNFLDLVKWGAMPEDVRPDLSEASEEFLRPLYDALVKSRGV